MNLEILRNEEKRMNLIMFLFHLSIPVAAFLFVILFNGGSAKDAVALIMVLSSVLIKVFEKNLEDMQNIYIFPLYQYAERLQSCVVPLVSSVQW